MVFASRSKAERRSRHSRNMVPMLRRSAIVADTWRIVDDSGPDSFGRSTPGPDTRTLELWRLALDARGIPYLVVGHGAGQRFFVPALWENIARVELTAVVKESAAAAAPTMMRAVRSIPWFGIGFFLLALALWYGLYNSWWDLGLEHFPEPEFWLQKGELAVYMVIVGEWWRVFTSLTLHKDLTHLCSNLLYSGIFLVVLCRSMSLGWALLLTVLAGALGNAIEVQYGFFFESSIGFSTAAFGMLGLLAAESTRGPNVDFRRVIMTFGAALALLALLGMSRETNYSAHIYGMASGVVIGLVAVFAQRTWSESSWEWLGKAQRPIELAGRTLERLAGALALGLLLGSWYLALR